MALDVYDVEMRHCTVALGTTWFRFTVVQVDTLCERVDAKHLITIHSPCYQHSLQYTDIGILVIFYKWVPYLQQYLVVESAELGLLVMVTVRFGILFCCLESGLFV